MESTRRKFSTVDEYFAAFPASTRNILVKMRDIIKQAAPKAEEVISYNIPAFRLYGRVLVYYAAYNTHIGFYPTASPMKVFKKELADYKTSKGAVQFRLDKPIPATLVKKIVKFRIQESLEKAKLKGTK